MGPGYYEVRDNILRKTSPHMTIATTGRNQQQFKSVKRKMEGYLTNILNKGSQTIVASMNNKPRIV